MIEIDFCCNPQNSQVTNAQVIQRLNQLQNLIYNPYFKVIMNDVLSYSVVTSVHKLHGVRGVTILDSLGNEVEAAVRISLDNSVYINSNVSLNNATLIIF